ncbi:hypothetical protein [Streptomyces sp. st115]|uniref:hypothetical protein n=1 Tax=Streptomyces sp. st115 TaxID=1828047 RepID=UPI000BF1B688|nr:hypothetical protein [Streptomyces sp. st115]
MTHFRRPPEWDQQADRHSTLKDPVLTVRQLPRLGFVPRRLTRIDHALVFSTASGSYITCLPPLRPSRSEVIRRRYTSVYEVDMGLHPLRLELSLPSSNDALQFEATVDLTWQVSDPAVFVASGLRDVPRLLVGELEQTARTLTRAFEVTRSAEAEAEVLRSLRTRLRLGVTAGLIVTWTLRLHRDQDNIEHQRRLQAIEHAAAERIRSHRRGLAEDEEIDRRERRRDELATEREMAYAQRRHELLLRQQQWQTELRDGDLAKVEFYRRHLEQGGVRAWALHLAEHPEDSRLVMQSLREDQVNMIRAKADMVAKLLEGDEAEGHELEGPKELALRALHDILNQQLPGAAPEQGPGLPRLPLAAAGSVGTEHSTAPVGEGAAMDVNNAYEETAPVESPSVFPGWQPPRGRTSGSGWPSLPKEDPHTPPPHGAPKSGPVGDETVRRDDGR